MEKIHINQNIFATLSTIKLYEQENVHYLNKTYLLYCWCKMVSGWYNTVKGRGPLSIYGRYGTGNPSND